jgi:DNA replication protein DnaC
VLTDEERRIRVLVATKHGCPERDAAQRSEFERMMRAPDPKEAARLRAECLLPGFAPAGLAALKEDAQNRKVLEKARALLAEFQAGKRDGGLYLWGAVGSGKTVTTAALGFDLAHKTGAKWLAGEDAPIVNWGKPAVVQWWSVPTLFEEIKRGFDSKPSRYNAESLRKADCLILDEFGNERATRFSISSLFRIINERYEDRRALVVSGNYSPPQLHAAVDDLMDDDPQTATMMRAIMDRLREMCEVVELRGQSRRKARG